MSMVVEAADAIVALIGDRGGCKAVREWTINREQAEFIANGWITVIPTNRTWPSRRSRVGFDREFEINIGVQKAIVGAQGIAAPKDQVDAVDALAEAIGELLMLPASKVIGTTFKATCQTVEGQIVISRELLQQDRIATSIMVARYKVDP